MWGGGIYSFKNQNENYTLSEKYGWRKNYAEDYFLDEKSSISIQRYYHLAKDDNVYSAPCVLFDMIQDLRRLLVLLIDRPMYLSYIEFANINDNTDKESRVRLFYIQVGDIDNAKKLSPVQPKSILIRKSDINDYFEKILCFWFINKKELREIIAPCISDLYVPSYVEVEFLNLSRGLESYHRFFVKQTSEEQSNVPDEREVERKKIIEFIQKHISAEYKDDFIGRVNYEKEETFRQRLNGLMKNFPEELNKQLFGMINTKRIISQIVDTRNYLTHRDSLLKYNNAISDFTELAEINKKLKIVFKFYCLILIGVDRTVVERRLLENLR